MRTTVKEVGFAIFFLVVIALVAVEAAEGATPQATATAVVSE